MTGTTDFTETFTIGYSTLDAQGLIKLVSILNFLQDTASAHAHHLGASGMDLARKKLSWVIHRYHIDIHDHPRWLESIAVKTHRHAWKNLYEVRDVAMESPGRSIPLVSARMIWIMVIKKNQRPVRLDRFLCDAMVAQHPVAPPDLYRLCPTDRVDAELSFKVRMHDLDLNGHVNNAVYVEWAVETLPRYFLETYRPGTIDVVFHGQAFYGDAVLSQTQIDRTGPGPVTRHTIYKKTDMDHPLTTLNVSWKKRKIEKGYEKKLRS